MFFAFLKKQMSSSVVFLLLLNIVSVVCFAGTPAMAQATSAPNHDGQETYHVIDSFNVGEGVYVRALAVDKAKNTIWVGTSVGVLEIDLKTNNMLNSFTRDDGLANEYVFAIGIDNEGYKWFGTNAGGTSRYKNGEWKTYFPMHGLADYWVYSFASQKNGDLWIGTWAGANHVDLKTGKWTTYVDELVNEWVYGLAVDAKDRVWFATEGGVSMYDGSKWKSWSHADGVGAENEATLKRNPNTGLGTRTRHDLGILSGGDASYNGNYVFAVVAKPDNTIWVGTWGGGVSHFDGKTWKNYTKKDGLAGNIVYSVALDDSGALWFGTNGGVSRFDGEKWLTLDIHNGLFDNSVYSVATAPDGNVWVGTRHGVSVIGR